MKNVGPLAFVLVQPSNIWGTVWGSS